MQCELELRAEALHCITQCCMAQCSITLYCIVWYYTVLYCTSLCCVVQCELELMREEKKRVGGIALYYAVLYGTVQHCNAPYSMVLYSVVHHCVELCSVSRS